MGDLIKTFLAPFSGGVAATLAILLILYFTQGRAASVGRFMGAVVLALLGPLHSLRRMKKRRTLQRRVNSMLSGKVNLERPFVVRKCRVKWEDPTVKRDAFFAEKRFIINVRRDFDTDEALIRTALLFISRSLLAEVKRFLTDPQRDALNLYYTGRVVEANSAALGRQFAVDYLPSTLDEDTADYLAIFDNLERHGLFEDVLVRQMEHVGGKVVALPRVDSLHVEFEALINMLRGLTLRRPSEEMDLVLERSFVRCATVLVARRENLSEDMETHVRFIQDSLTPRQIDRIYLLSDRSKRASVDALTNALASDWSVSRRKSRRAVLLGAMHDTYIVELTSINSGVFTSSIIAYGGGNRFREHPAEVVALRRGIKSVVGSIKFVADDGWGFIKLDDPSFAGADAWFDVASIVDRPALIEGGDKVECELVRDQRGIRATSVRVILGARRASPMPLSV